jgi:hypothetical protein
MDVAAASGTTFHKICAAERKLLEAIHDQLEPHRHAAASAGTAGR